MSKYMTNAQKREAGLLPPKIDRQWVKITEPPSRLEGDLKLCIQYLLKVADSVEYIEFPKDASQYKAFFDDGAYKGYFTLSWTENGINPLSILDKLESIGWPGFNTRHWKNDAARNELNKRISKS